MSLRGRRSRRGRAVGRTRRHETVPSSVTTTSTASSRTSRRGSRRTGSCLPPNVRSARPSVAARHGVARAVHAEGTWLTASVSKFIRFHGGRPWPSVTWETSRPAAGDASESAPTRRCIVFPRICSSRTDRRSRSTCFCAGDGAKARQPRMST